MSSIREQIVAAFVATLTDTGAEAYRSRSDAVSRPESPALIVTPQSEDVNIVTTHGVDRLLSLQVEVITRGDVPDSLADPIIVAAHQKIMADQTLGGLCFDIAEVSSQWAIESGDLDICSLIAVYRVHYRTAMKALDQEI